MRSKEPNSALAALKPLSTAIRTASCAAAMSNSRPMTPVYTGRPSRTGSIPEMNRRLPARTAGTYAPNGRGGSGNSRLTVDMLVAPWIQYEVAGHLICSQQPMRGAGFRKRQHAIQNRPDRSCAHLIQTPLEIFLRSHQGTAKLLLREEEIADVERDVKSGDESDRDYHALAPYRSQ